MKKLFTISFMLAVMSAAAQTWYTINPITGIEGLNDISMLDPTNGLAVGKNGVILKFSNNGWSKMESPVNEDLNSVHYVNPNAAWAVGENGTVLHYNGTAWVQQISNTTALLKDVFFLGEDNGWAVGNTILHYDGNAWAIEMDEHSLYAVHFYDASEGWAVGKYGKTMKYDGTQWNLISGFVNDFFLTDVEMTGPESGWMCGWSIGGSALFHEYNGESWQASGSNMRPGYGLAFNDHNHGWALHNITAPLVSRSRIYNIGEGNWSNSLVLGWEPVLTAIDIAGSDEVFVSTSGGIIYHQQNGSWQLSNGFADDHIYGIEFLTPTYGFIAAGRNGLMKYSNGNWTTELTFEDFVIDNLVFTTDGTGWAAGSSEFDDNVEQLSKIFKYEDGEWEEDYQFDEFFGPVLAFHALDEHNAWAGFWFHLFTRTEDGWMLSSPDNIIAVSAIHFVDAENGWMSASQLPNLNASIFRYQNGVWTINHVVADGKTVKDFGFLEDGTAYAVGDQGLILYYDGSAWSEINSPTTAHLEVIAMIDHQSGWIGGENGTLLYFDGSSWEVQDQNINTRIYSFCFPDNTIGLMGGANGAFLATLPQLPVGIKQPIISAATQTVNIFPNPATSHVRIEYYLKESGMIHFDVYDLSGRKVLATAPDQKSAGLHNEELILGSLKKGVYILKVQQANGISQSAKLMVK
jgi:photosystem II stability/assembly factor-like uncharacterized protein